jgi:hypothetical protein
MVIASRPPAPKLIRIANHGQGPDRLLRFSPLKFFFAYLNRRPSKTGRLFVLILSNPLNTIRLGSQNLCAFPNLYLAGVAPTNKPIRTSPSPLALGQHRAFPSQKVKVGKLQFSLDSSIKNGTLTTCPKS